MGVFFGGERGIAQLSPSALLRVNPAWVRILSLFSAMQKEALCATLHGGERGIAQLSPSALLRVIPLWVRIPSLLFRHKKNTRLGVFYGGERGIRTHVALPPNGFREIRVKGQSGKYWII